MGREVKFTSGCPIPLTDEVRGTIVMKYLAGRAITTGFEKYFDEEDKEFDRSRVKGFDSDDSYCCYVEEKKPHWEDVVKELQSVIDDGGELYIEFFD